jgi:transcriptional regulator with XRE-family HTH domain
MDVGFRLKTVRRSAGLSQRELASRAGVTNGLISLIEQNRTSPSVSTLRRILEALPMSFSEFFAVESALRTKIFYRADELAEINPGRLQRLSPSAAGLSRRQVGDASGHSLQMLHERYESGADTGEELCSHEGEEAGIIVSGEIELTVGETTRTLRKGDAYIFDSRIPHRFRNRAGAACEIVSACTPPAF